MSWVYQPLVPASADLLSTPPATFNVAWATNANVVIVAASTSGEQSQ